MNTCLQIIEYDYNNLTCGIIGTQNLVYQLLNNSNSKDDMIVNNPVTEPLFTIDELNKFYVRCVNGNLVGSKLWIAYKFSNKDLKTLVDNVKNWNQEMVSHVNQLCIPGNVQDPEKKIPKDTPSDSLAKFKLFH
jgi:hypothetical protein